MKKLLLLYISIGITHITQAAYAGISENQPYTTQSYNQPTITSQTPSPTFQQPYQSLPAELISANLFYTNQQQLFNQTNSFSLHFDGPFTMDDFEDGLSLHIAIYPPSTETLQQPNTFNQPQPTYLIVGLLKSNDGTIVSRKEAKVALQTPPAQISISYNSNTISRTKTLFTPDNRISNSHNKLFFNKKAPMIKKFFIQKTSAGIIAK